MTESATTLTTNHNPAWDEQFAAIKARHPNVRDAILVALHIVSQNPDIELADAKAQAALHGVRITAASVKVKLWNGCHSSGSDVIWFQSMKSGMPGVVWILVLTGSDASSFRNIAMQ